MSTFQYQRLPQFLDDRGYLRPYTKLRHVANTSGESLCNALHRAKMYQLGEVYCSQCNRRCTQHFHSAHVRLRYGFEVFLITTCPRCNWRSNIYTGEEYFTTRFPHVVTPTPFTLRDFGRTRDQLQEQRIESYNYC